MTRKLSVFAITCSAIVAVAALVGCLLLLSGFQSAKMEHAEQIAAINKIVESQQAVISEKAASVSADRAAIIDYSKKLSSVKAQLATDKAIISSYRQQVAQASADSVSGPRMCYLTFDDGPSDNTLKILKILDKNNIKATFFVTAQDRTDYLPQIAKAGHTIGLHTYSHDWDIYNSVDSYFKDLNKISKLVKDKTGIDSKVIRFPGGSSNTVSRSYCSGIMSRLAKEVQSRGYAYFDWNCSSGDAEGNHVPADRLLRNVKADSKGMKSITVLMHDTSAKDTTVEALPSIIEYLKSKGFKFDKLTESTRAVHHGINN